MFLFILLYFLIYFLSEKFTFVEGYEDCFIAVCLALLLVVFIVYTVKTNKIGDFFIRKAEGTLGYLIPLTVLPAANILYACRCGFSSNFAVSHICVIMLAAVFEELFFRGYLLSRLSRFFCEKPYFAVLISSFAFGALHFLNISDFSDGRVALQAVLAFATGNALGCVTFKCRSIYPAIITHVLINATSVFCENINLDSIYVGVYSAVSVFYLVFSIIIYPKEKKNEFIH